MRGETANHIAIIIVLVVIPIDFGVAKAIGQQLTDKSVYTNFSQFIGTPLYMSPEQAGQSDLDIDTRTDIYALGVLLYELLTGTTPFDKDRLSKASYDEIRRLIREEEPPKPRKFQLSIPDTFEGVVLEMLAKRPEDRFDTPTALLKDLERVGKFNGLTV